MSPKSSRSTAGMSIQRKLPLLVSGFVFVVIVLYSLASYETVKAASIDVARQRVLALSAQIAQLYDQTIKTEAKATHTLVSNGAILRFVASAGKLAKDSALKVLRTGGVRPEQTLRTEILDSSGAPVFAMPSEPLERHAELSSEITKAGVAPDYAAVGHFRLINDTIVVPVVAAVVENDHPVGYVVRWRRITSGTKEGRDALSKLLGDGAELYIGNDRGDLWTDLVSAAPGPPAGANLRPGKISVYTRPGGSPVVATIRPFQNVPWVVLLELSQQTVMAPANAFLARALVIGLVVLAVATVMVWIVSRSITRPLAELTDAASAIAAGNYATVVASNRTDEIGELSRAFNTMTRRVEESQEGLEEKVRERTELLHERNEELETFAHSISHDLRAPLRAMHGFSQALLEDCGAQLDDTGKDYAVRVVAGARRMDSLIQDLLAYSRVSRTDMALTTVSLGEAVHEAIMQLEADIVSSGGTVTVAPGLPEVRAHRVALVQAIANLIANALKFMPAGAKPAVRVRADRAGEMIRLWVEDNGIGIAAAHHERVFGVFERLHQSETYPGTGIGLAIVRKSAERMGGHVGVVSAPNEGSRFWIDLKPGDNAS